jgi:hypothetical protein
MSEKLIMLHGFTQEEALRCIRAVKAASEDPKSIAFCMTTETNLDWKVKELIAEVLEEHTYMMQQQAKKENSGETQEPQE